MNESTSRFRVDASLMQHLGESLITDDLQALIELIKNAYDADASQVRLIIDSDKRIVVTDDGHGMDAHDIDRGWLTLSNSLKRVQKAEGRMTARYSRTPLGDKGLGRLSAQRLGNMLRIDTVPEAGDKRLSVKIDWAKFRPGVDLSQVPVDVQTRPRGDHSVGTTITISNLVSPEYWRKLDPGELRRVLALVISPYEEVASFRLQAFLNGEEVSPDLAIPAVRRVAMQHFDMCYSGKALEISGTLRGPMFRGMTRTSRLDYDTHFKPDEGQGFLDFLLASKKSTNQGLERSASHESYLGFRIVRHLDTLDASVDPGPFHGAIDSFSLDSTSSDEILKSAEVFSSSKQAREFVKALSGIKVFRDGFVVRTAHDWLELGKGQTAGGSYYGLRPYNTIGYVAIGAHENAQLREKTDREGFVDDAVYACFRSILESFVETANQLLQHLRRSWTEYVREKKKLAAELPSLSSEAFSGGLNRSFTEAADAKDLVRRATQRIEVALAQETASLFPPTNSMQAILTDVQELLAEAVRSLGNVARRKNIGSLLVSELDALNEQLGQVYEMVSLGITTETLSHEISNVLERLRAQTHSIQRHAQDRGVDDMKVLRYFEVVRSAVSALEKQIGHLDPALRFVREKRDRFALSELLGETAEYYQSRYHAKPMKFAVDVRRDFVVEMNKGKLIQVLDNLILNSEYWLKVGAAARRGAGVINVTVERPNVVVEDNGLGIEPAFEETLFDPFVTAKPKGTGRGLGLFIATQLLETDGCTLDLLLDRNQTGRRYKMSIGLSSVVADSQ